MDSRDIAVLIFLVLITSVFMPTIEERVEEIEKQSETRLNRLQAIGK